MQRRLAIRLALAAIWWPLAAAAAGPINIDRHGLAVKGYDPVAYFTQGRPVRGRPEFRAQHDGATYQFASQENRDRFAAAPAKYLPQFGGYCAYGVSQGTKADIDPAAFTVIDGKLYLNLDADIQGRWRRDTAGYISSANARWPSVIHQ